MWYNDKKIIGSDFLNRQILSFVFSILGLLSMIFASMIKGERMKRVLFLVFCGNVFVAVSYILGGRGFNGAATCFVGSIQAIINYFFDSKKKPIPTPLVVIYALSFISVNIIVSKGLGILTLLAITASLAFVMCIVQKSSAKYRFWTIINVLLWCAYDILSKSYGALANHIPLFLFTVIGMCLHDRNSHITRTNQQK